jgi:hypothetical protein
MDAMVVTVVAVVAVAAVVTAVAVVAVVAVVAAVAVVAVGGVRDVVVELEIMGVAGAGVVVRWHIVERVFSNGCTNPASHAMQLMSCVADPDGCFHFVSFGHVDHGLQNRAFNSSE